MARVTVDDCLGVVPNRFQLVRLASKRARDLVLGRASASLPWGNHKATVIALKEIATGQVDSSYLDPSESLFLDPKHAEQQAQKMAQSDLWSKEEVYVDETDPAKVIRQMAAVLSASDASGDQSAARDPVASDPASPPSDPTTDRDSADGAGS